MAIKIKEMYGYQITYEPRDRRFLVEDSDGTELAYSKTQDDIEAKAKVLSKQDFTRISIVKVEQEGKIRTGELTSLNRDDESAWISMAKDKDGWGRGRQKIGLNYSQGYYELTDANNKILEVIKTKHAALNQARAEIKALIDTLEKRINSDYGVKDNENKTDKSLN